MRMGVVLVDTIKYKPRLSGSYIIPWSGESHISQESMNRYCLKRHVLPSFGIRTCALNASKPAICYRIYTSTRYTATNYNYKARTLYRRTHPCWQTQTATLKANHALIESPCVLSTSSQSRSATVFAS